MIRMLLRRIILFPIFCFGMPIFWSIVWILGGAQEANKFCAGFLGFVWRGVE